MQNKIIALAIAATMFTSQQAMAEIEEDTALWLNANAQGNLPIENLRWYAEAQPRYRAGGQQLDQLLLRPAVFYKLSTQSNVWLGYASVASYPLNKPMTQEHRVWQQYLYSFEPIDTVKILSRTRLEQRRLELRNETGHRIRQMIKMTKPLQDSPTLSWVLQDELFVNFNNTDWGARSGFDRNRLFAGVAWALYTTVTIETGYMNQYVNRPTKPTDRVDHILNTNVFVNF